jgi:acetyl esterase/lipase
MYTHIKWLLLLFFFCINPKMTAQDSILLWPQGAPGALGTAPEDKPCVYYYPAAKNIACGTAVLICPGGGYAHLAMDHEGKQVAEWFNRQGVDAFILKYRLNTWDNKKYKYPAQFDDATRALRLVRSLASRYGYDPFRIGIMGFSAGGHLVSTVATHFDAGKKGSSDEIERQSSRPDFLILGYPVISLTTEYTHRFSREMVLGKELDPELARYLSSELQVTSLTPPTFLFHTNADDGVPAENSLLFFMALRKAGVPAELHVYQNGKHGVGLLPADPVLASWADRLHDWLKVNNWIKE